MAPIHVSREILRAVLRGELTPQMLLQIGWEHLIEACPYCRLEFEAFQREQRSNGFGGFARTAGVGREEGQAERELRDLLQLSPEERISTVDRARVRFRSAALVRLLLRESERRIPTDRKEALHLAELAGVVTRVSPLIPRVFDLMVLACAYVGNARRVGDDPRKAEEHFRQARSIMDVQGVTDLAVIARVDELEGTLRKDQRLFPAAEGLYTRAILLHRLVSDRIGQARTLLALGTLHNLQGDPGRAADATRSALEKIGRAGEPRLYMIGRYNLARYLVEAGDHEAAADLLDKDAELFRRFPEPSTQLRLTWLRGKISAGLGSREEAERAFLEARDGFVAQGNAFDAAMVSVEDLAILYLQQGRTEEVKHLTEEMLAVFEAQDVHREALAALVLFQEAARREEVTRTLLQELADYLKASQSDPSLRFREPS
ncbi:MAG TPA: hypothetical protein VN493_06980 [Thermoanaerobaculia bacterium]|nr:hypothetical protein [Thermoanaerobaculia bacterium]